jgi:hypothetical protein
VIKVRSPTDASGRAQSAPSEPTSPPPTQPSPPVATMPLQSPISSEAPQTLPPPPSTAAARARRSEPDAASSATPAPTTLPLAEAPATTAPASTPAPSSLAPRATVKEGRFERVVDFATGAPVSFEGRVGAIHASSVRFQAKDGRSSRFKKLFKRDSEPWVTLRAQFEVQRDKDAGDWHVVLGVDLLDDASNTVGTLTGSSTAEDDRQTLTLEEEFPQRVFQRVKTVRLRLDAAPD